MTVITQVRSLLLDLVSQVKSSIEFESVTCNKIRLNLGSLASKSFIGADCSALSDWKIADATGGDIEPIRLESGSLGIRTIQGKTTVTLEYLPGYKTWVLTAFIFGLLMHASSPGCF